MVQLNYIFCSLGIFFFQLCLVYSSCSEENTRKGFIEHTYVVSGSGLHRKCWKIKNPERTSLFIKIQRLNLLSTPASVGSLTINLKSESKALEYWSQSHLDNFTTTSFEVEIHFKVDSANFGKGGIASFKLHFNRECEKVYTELAGNISSPLYPGNYPNAANCTYHIRLRPGYLINFTVHDLKLEDHTHCSHDYLQVYDVDVNHQNEDVLILRLCGNIVPDPVISSGNRLKMIFKSDRSTTFRGFYATYSAVQIETSTEAPSTLRTHQPTNDDKQEHNTIEITEKSEENFKFRDVENYLESEAEKEKSRSKSNGTEEKTRSNSLKMEFDEHQIRMEILDLQKQFETERIEFQRSLENERLKKLRFEFESLKIMFAERKTEEASVD